MSSTTTTFDLIVRNLPTQITENDLSYLFGKYGTIIGMSIKDTNRDGKKYAFIRFGSQSAVDNAILNSANLVFNSMKIFVDKADKKDPSRNESSKRNSYRQLNGAGEDYSKVQDDMWRHDSENSIDFRIQEEKLIMITHVETACLLYAQDEVDVDKAAELDAKINEVAENLPQLLGRPLSGKIYVAKFSVDGNWYRCQMYAPINACQIEVIYCDYGNREVVDLLGLFVLPDIYANIKPYAKCYKLFGLKIVEALPIQTLAKEHMEKYQHKLLTILIHSSTSHGAIPIEILSETGLEINKELLELGYAVADVPATQNDVNTQPVIKNCAKPIKLERGECLVEENKAYAQQLRKCVEEKQELQRKIDSLNKITFTRKMVMVEFTSRKIHQLRKKFSTDVDVEDVIDTAIATEALTSDLKVKKESIENIKRLMSNLKEMQEAIVEWKIALPLPQEMSEEIDARNKKRVELHQALSEYVEWLSVQPLDRYQQLTENTWKSLEQSYSSYVLDLENVDETEESLKNVIEAYQAWKESKIAEYKAMRILTDASKQSFIDAMTFSLEFFKNNNPDDDFEFPDVDGLLGNYRIAMEAELSNTNQKSDEVEIIKNLVHVLAARIKRKRNDVSVLTADMALYSEWLRSVTLGRSTTPDYSGWEDIAKNIRTYKSKLRHLLADKLDAEEEKRFEDLTQVNSRIDEVRIQLHNEFKCEDQLIYELSILARDHFPELIVQCSAIPLLNCIDYNGLIKIGRSLTHFRLEQVDDRKTVFKSQLSQVDVIIKEYNVGTKEIMISRIIEYNKLHPGQIKEAFFDMDDKMCYIIFSGDLSLESAPSL